MTSLLMGILRLSLYGSLTTVLILVCKKILGSRISPITHYALWFVLILRLCIPPLSSAWTTSNYSTQNSFLKTESGNITESTFQQQPSNDLTLNTEITNNANKNFDISIFDILGAVYCIGLGTSSFLFIQASRKERKSWKKGNLPKNVSNTIEKLNKSHKKLSAKNIIIADCDSPYLTGFFYPQIILPKEFVNDDIPEEVLCSVIQHEFAHWSQGDLWIFKIVAILQSIHWFNPILWIAFKKMRQDAELACDVRVTNGKTQQQRIQYGSALLFVAERCVSKNSNVALYFSHHPLKNRMATVLSGRNLPKHYILRAWALPVILSLFLLLPNASGQQMSSVPWVVKDDGLYILTGDQTFVRTDFPLAEIPHDDINNSYVYADSSHILVLARTNPIKMFLSLNDGKTWTRTTLPYNFPNKLFVGFSSPKSGWMMFENTENTGTIEHIFLTTSDYGKTWEKKPLPSNLSTTIWNDFLFTSKDEGFICCEQNKNVHGKLYQTQDAGSTWESVTLPNSITNDPTKSIIDIEYFDGTLLLTVGTAVKNNDTTTYEIQKYVSQDKNYNTWKECNDELATQLLSQNTSTLVSDLGYKLTLPYFWNGHVVNKPTNNQIFSLYESYNYSIPTDDTNEHYGYVFSIQAIPLEGTSVSDRRDQFVLGEDDEYYFVINESGGINCAHNTLAELYYRMVNKNCSWIFQRFAEENHLKINQACYIFE